MKYLLLFSLFFFSCDQFDNDIDDELLRETYRLGYTQGRLNEAKNCKYRLLKTDYDLEAARDKDSTAFDNLIIQMKNN